MILEEAVIDILLASQLTSTSANLRIVSSNKAEPGEIPWQVSVNGSPDWYMCGGVILSEDFIITSASCTSWVTVNELWIGAGSIERSNPLSKHAVIQRIVHPEFDEVMQSPSSHDLAILQVTPRFDFNSKYEQPARLPSSTDPPNAGTLTTFSGWGSTDYSAPVSEVLLKAELPVMNKDQCDGSYGSQSGAFCTDYGTANEDPCQNDAGGPLTANEQLIGVLVRGYGCHQLVQLPALHADVAFHSDWIREVTGLP